MEKTKVTVKEFKTLLKEIGFADVKEDGYGYILLVIASDLISDAAMHKRCGCNAAYRHYMEQACAIKDFLITHGYFNKEERITRNESRN